MAEEAQAQTLEDLLGRLTELAADHFRACLNQAFRIHVPGLPAPLAAELIEVRGLGGYTQRGDRNPFSLLFRGPANAPLQQGIYRLDNDTLGAIAIFLVTLGPDPADRTMRYEAIFT